MSEQQRCVHCGHEIVRTVGNGIWQSALTGSACYENRGLGNHEPAAPEPRSEQTGKRYGWPKCNDCGSVGWHKCPAQPATPPESSQIPGGDEWRHALLEPLKDATPAVLKALIVFHAARAQLAESALAAERARRERLETALREAQQTLRESEIRRENLNFTFEVPHKYRKYRQAYESGYESGWRGWGEDRCGYTSIHHRDAWLAGYRIADMAVTMGQSANPKEMSRPCAK